MGKIIKDGVEYDFGSDIIYHLISSGDSDDSGDSKDITFIDLGSGTSFDVSSYDGYENFTVDNFVVKEITETSISKLGYNSGTATAAQNAVNLKSTMELVKEYDSSTGILTCYIKHYAYVKSSNTSSDAVTLTDTQNAPVNVLLVLNGTSDGSGDANIDAIVDTLNLGEPDYELSSGTFTAGWNTIQCGCKASIVIFQCHYGDYYGYGISDLEHGVYWNSFANSTLELLSCLENVRNVTDTSFDVMLTDSYDLIIDKLLVYSGSATGSGDAVEEEKVLLWENTKPTSSFAAQTVTLSQSIEDFDWVEILVYQSTSLKTKPAVYRYQVEQLMDETFHMNLTNKAAFGFVNRCNSSGHFYSRAIGVTSSTGLFFTAALRRDKNTAFEETTAQLIPYQIYGVKNGVIIEEIVNNKANIPTKLLKTVTSSAKNGDNTYTITKDEIGNNDTILMVSSIYTRNGSSSTGAANDITGVTNASYTVISDTHYAVVAKLYDIKGDVTVTVKHNMANVHEQNTVMFYGL